MHSFLNKHKNYSWIQIIIYLFSFHNELEYVTGIYIPLREFQSP